MTGDLRRTAGEAAAKASELSAAELELLAALRQGTVSIDDVDEQTIARWHEKFGPEVLAKLIAIGHGDALNAATASDSGPKGLARCRRVAQWELFPRA